MRTKDRRTLNAGLSGFTGETVLPVDVEAFANLIPAPVLSSSHHPTYLCRMSNDIITVGECLRLMDEGKPFTLTLVTYDRKRRTGGELREIEGYVEQLPDGNEPDGDYETARPLTPQEAAIRMLNHRNPNHGRWYTRNVRLTANGHPTAEIRKVHPPLFVTFNGKKVVP